MPRELLSVTELNEYLKSLLDGNAFLADILVRGEISNFKNHYATGHCYFSLKDETGTVRAVMFRSYAAQLRFLPENGMKVILHGRVSVFPRSGDYQIYVDDMQPDGIGTLAIAFEQLRRKLEGEGLFAEERKRPIPAYPERIGIITSPTGAAVRDMIQVLGRRYPLAEIILYPALVQGPGAPESLVEGLHTFAVDIPVDLILIGRGGGSMEDLWCFNHENLVRAVAASPVPVISAVGHETDFTLCDFAADLRAPTPSAAAELAAPDREALAQRIADIAAHMDILVARKIQFERAEINRISSSAALRSPKYVIDEKRMSLAFWGKHLEVCGENMIAVHRSGFVSICTKLQALNPMGVLSRGYGMIFDRNGKTVHSAHSLSEGNEILVKLKDGDVSAVVTRSVNEVKHGREKTEI